MNKPSIYIGIDPDADKSGLAVVNTKERHAHLVVLPFFELLDAIRMYVAKACANDLEPIVIIEGGWLNKGNWHLTRRDSRFSASAIGRKVGMNHQTGILIAEYCKTKAIPYKVVVPLWKCWSGHDHKITHAELIQFADIDTKRENQEARDACLLAWYHAGLPIRLPPITKQRGHK